MKVLVPLNDINHIQTYRASGAEEFYIGFYDEKWHKRFGKYADINRMSGYQKAANRNSFEGMIKIINLVKDLGESIFVTFNSSLYSKEQLSLIKEYMVGLKQTGVDGVIVSCIELVELAREVGITSVVSTIAGVYNSDIARFYYERGAKRIILPRDLNLDEIETIVKSVPEAEYEVFLMRNGCTYSDSHCLGFHRHEMCGICSSIHHANRKLTLREESFNNRHAAELNDIIYSKSFHQHACGLCSIYRFVKLGIAAGKIVGRTDEYNEICKDIAYVKRNIEIAKRCDSEEMYLKQMIFPKEQATLCKLGLSCYYPEVRF